MAGIVQSVIGEKRGRVRTRQMQITHASQPPTCFLDIELFEHTHQSRPCRMVECGKTYRLQVSKNVASDKCYSEQKSVPVDPDIELSLTCTSELGIDRQTFSLSALFESPSKYECSFTIPEHLPDSDLTFELHYSSKGLQKSATTLQIKLKGSYNLEQKSKMAELSHVDLDTLPPQHSALLYVGGSRAGTADLQGWYDGRIQFQKNRIEWISVSLAEAVKNGTLTDIIIGQFSRFSRQKLNELNTWLYHLVDKYRDQLCVIIVDCTDFATPWEMIYLDDDMYLGAITKVVRWASVQKQHGGARLLRMQEMLYQGTILAYINEAKLGLQQTTPERSLFASLNVKYDNTLFAFKKALFQLESVKDIGLIYIADHGYDGISIGSRPRSEKYSSKEQVVADEQELIVADELERLITQPEQPRPIIFANFCESALMLHHSQHRYGRLLDVLLAKVANGYIGTLAKVGSLEAARVAQRILQEAHYNPEGVQIAEVLRHLREEVVRKYTLKELRHLDTTEKEKREKDFLYTFLYVYYGNPLARLRLTEVNGTEAEHE